GRLRAERDLQKSEQQLRLITDGLPVLIAYIDSQERFQFSNRVHQEWWGKSKNQIVGQPMVQVVGEETYRRALPHVRAALSGKQVTFERAFDYPGSGRRYVHVSYIPHFHDQDTVRGFFVLVTDQSDKVRL